MRRVAIAILFRIFCAVTLPGIYGVNEYDIQLNWGRPMPAWPTDFGDRLDILRFNFSKNSETGMAEIGVNNAVEL